MNLAKDTFIISEEDDEIEIGDYTVSSEEAWALGWKLIHLANEINLHIIRKATERHKEEEDGQI